MRILLDFWESWSDEAIETRGFWSSLPWFLLCFGTAMAALLGMFVLLAAAIALITGEPAVFWGALVALSAVWLLNTVGFSVYNALQQRNVPWGR